MNSCSVMKFNVEEVGTKLNFADSGHHRFIWLIILLDATKTQTHSTNSYHESLLAAIQ